MTEPYTTTTTSGAFPFPYRHADNLDISKYSPASTANASAYESESPLAAHSSTTASSRLSGSYEPSQVGSYMEEQSAHMQGTDSLHQQPQRPQLSHLIMPSPTMNVATSHARPNAIHAPYTNYHAYPNYYVGSPVVQEHAYSYSPVHATPEQHHAAAAGRPMYFPTPISPPPLPAATYPHPQMSRRTSFGVYYSYDYPHGTALQSPTTPYAYPQSSSMMYMPPTPTQHQHISPPPITTTATTTHTNMHRQTRPAAPSPLRPQPTSSHSVSAVSNRRQANNTLYSSASSFGHQASVLAGRYQRDHQRGEAPTTPPRSAILTDFKNQKFKRFELKDIFGNCTEFSTDQHGSRFIQQKLDLATPDERQAVFDEIVPAGHALRLMMDVFGNYVIQKLFEYGTTLQKSLLCGKIEGHVLSLSLDMYGCRVIQKAIECVLPQQQSAIVAELDGHILQCVKDANGNHVIQKLLERVVPERMTFVNAFTDNVYNLATHPYGCRVLQRCFEHVSAEQVMPLLEELHQNATALMQDQFGNYVIQFILERGSTHDRHRMIDALIGQLSTMSRHKFASNVCEKVMAVADPSRRRRIVEEMLAPGSTGITLVSVMMKDQYANYVLQKAISLVEGDLLDSLVTVVIPQLANMRRHPTTANSKQLTSIERLLKEKGFNLEPPQPLHLVVSPPVSQADNIPSGSPTP